MTKAAPNPDGYVHARTPEEYDRLRAQARAWEGATRRALARAGIAPGMSCLDIGSGPGETMRVLGEAVGPEGIVVGVDVDPAIGTAALARIRSSGTARYDYVTADIFEVTDISHGPFDLAFTRITLLHLNDPVAALRKMVGWTKPGGIVVAQEYDFASLDVEPHFPAWEEFRRVFEGVFNAHDRGMRVGRNLPALFRAAGLGEPDGFHSEVRFASLASAAANITGVYSGLVPAALALGLTTETRARAFAEDMAEAGRDPTRYTLSPLLIAAWKRLPG